MNDQEKLNFAKAVAVLRSLKFPPQTKDDIDIKTRAFWAVLSGMKWTAEDIESACLRLLRKNVDYPAPGEFMDAVQWAIDRRRQAEVSRFILCIDTDGKTMFAPPERVRDGVLLPAGSTDGNGLSLQPTAPELPHRRITARYMDGTTIEDDGA